MGFGLHCGWAIEGAIGSHYKIDATYMSPHVEMSDRLEAGSKIFGTPINISHWLVGLMSRGARKLLRPMDRILVSGCETPMTVYTFDVTDFPENFGIAKIGPDGAQEPVDFMNDPQFRELQKSLHPEFLETYRNGLKKYIKGSWGEAKKIMEMCLMLKPNDGPTNRILKAMSAHNFKSPGDWKGYVDMGDKY